MKKGLTIIEVIMAMVIIGIAFYTLIAIYVTLAPRDVRVENINKKIYLAQEKAEEFLAKPFTEAATVGATAFPGNFGEYSYRIFVTRVATDLATPSSTAPFRKVQVQVWGGPVDTLGTVEITGLLASYEVQ